MIEICLEPMKSGLLCGGPEHQAVALYEWLQLVVAATYHGGNWDAAP